MAHSDPTAPISDPADPDAEIPPDGVQPAAPTPARSPQEEAPDRDTPAWEGSDPADSVGLVDPRREIRTPPGL